MKKLRDIKQTRSYHADLKTRDIENTDEKIIEGYFAVFSTETELWPGAFESIAPNAFDNSLSNDIRALINHDTGMVLGRNKSGTLELKIDSRGLWGKVVINEKDSDALNLYERVKRGDVDQCSFGFNIMSEETDFGDDGTVKWTITEADLHEVSVVTFPAYQETGVQARHNQLDQHREKMFEHKKEKLRGRLRNVKSNNAE